MSLKTWQIIKINYNSRCLYHYKIKMSGINKPKKWDEELKLIYEWLTDEQKDRLIEILIQDNNERANKKYNNTEAAIKDLKAKNVKIEENTEMMGYKWKKVHINLPAVWNFKWFKFECFVSDEAVTKSAFESNPELEKKSYSMSDISKLLEAINKYMTELWIKNDGKMDYENKLKHSEFSKFRCNAWDCLKSITWLHSRYWLSDKNVLWKNGSQASLFCLNNICRIDHVTINQYDANLFLKLSD